MDPKSNAGARTDLVALQAMLRSGASLADVADEHFSNFIRYPRGIAAYLDTRIMRRNFRTQCIWFWHIIFRCRFKQKQFTEAVQNVQDMNEDIYFGKHKYSLEIKSAITGANCFVTLYKCKARYDLPLVAYDEAQRTPSAFNYADNSWNQVAANFNSGPTLVDAFADVNTILNELWYQTYTNDQVGHDYINATADGQWKHQEGTTLYNNKEFCKLFKVVKQYKFELLPGQKAVLQLKDKYIKKMNQIKMLLNKSYLCTKGQVFFILQLQGAVGHQASWSPSAQLAEQKYFNGQQSRPNIGIMPAAVDVMCVKQLNCWMVPKKAAKVRNIVRVADYYDDDGTETIAANYFADCAPSDYADSSAVIS
jgi:hypothetical protein